MEQAEAIDVVVADDHDVVRSAVRALLEAEDDMRIVAEAADAAAAVAKTLELHPHVLLLDLNMPGKASLDAIAELSAAGAKTGVVVLTMEDSPEIARRSLAAGAGGYVLKRAAERDLVHAVRAVARGETPGDGRGEIKDGESAGPPGGLTEREAQVLGLIALGHTSSEIGSILSISVRTAESHRAHVQQKLGLSDRPSLVRFALDHGLIPLD